MGRLATERMRLQRGPLPALQRDGLTHTSRATSAPGLGSPVPHLQQRACARSEAALRRHVLPSRSRRSTSALSSAPSASAPLANRIPHAHRRASVRPAQLSSAQLSSARLGSAQRDASIGLLVGRVGDAGRCFGVAAAAADGHGRVRGLHAVGAPARAVPVLARIARIERTWYCDYAFPVGCYVIMILVVARCPRRAMLGVLTWDCSLS